MRGATRLWCFRVLPTNLISLKNNCICGPIAILLVVPIFLSCLSNDVHVAYEFQLACVIST